MPKLVAEDADVHQVTQVFAAYDGLDHLRARRRAALVVVESGPPDDPIPHARFRRVAVHLWELEMATHTGQWQPSGVGGPLDRLLDALIHDFGWTLARIV